jgi:hypothetical protein
MTTIEIKRDEDQEWMAFYDQLWEEEQQIKKALRGIDRAREKLTLAQNVLVRLTQASDEVTRLKWIGFYNGGGVTAEDWEDDLYRTKYPDAKKISRGPLRLIHSSKQEEQKVVRYRPQTLDDNGPDAA